MVTNIKEFKILKESKDLSYTSFFGKFISHDNALIDLIKSYLIDIEMDVNNISEKDFRNVDIIMQKINEFFTNNDILQIINEINSDDKRHKLIAELIWHKYLRN